MDAVRPSVLLAPVILVVLAVLLALTSPVVAAPGGPPSVQDVPIGGKGAGVLGLDGSCLDKHSRSPVIRPGREADIVALFAPHPTETALAGHAGWMFTGITVSKNTIVATVAGPSGPSTLTLAWVGCAAPDARTSRSFVLRAAGTAGPAETLALAVRRNDPGAFWRAFSRSKTHQVVPVANADGSGETAHTVERRPWRESNGVVLLLLALCLLAWLIETPRLLRELRLRGVPGARATMAWLFGLTLGGLVLRFLAEPTFIREAYRFPVVFWQSEELGNVLYTAVDGYPKGPETLMHFIGPWLSSDPYEAWFSARLHLGALTIPWAFAVGASIFKRRAAGLVFAATLALWPQHVRMSASESTHVDFLFFGMATVALLIMAARSGRFTTFLAAACAAAATAVMRPEAALILPGALILGLAAGPKLRQKWRHPAYGAVVLGLAWVLLPSMEAILGDSSAANFSPSQSHNEGLGFAAIGRTLTALVMPDGTNALFDPQITPVWLYPLMIFGAVRLFQRGQRGVAVGLGVLVVTYLGVYSGMPPAVTIWKMGRYHTALLIGAAPLAAAGLWFSLEAVPRITQSGRHFAAAAALGAVGLAAWWPAIAALPMDWQRDASWTIELGRKHADRLGTDAVRIVLPDNRRRFLDMSPRNAIIPLTQQRQTIANAVTIEHALARLGTTAGAGTPETYYFESLFCFMARDFSEPMNPQCAAMHQTFQLTEIDRLEIDDAPYLSAYAEVRLPAPLVLRLYRVGSRKLAPAKASALLPKPLERGANQRLNTRAPMGHSTSQYMESVEPPL